MITTAYIIAPEVGCDDVLVEIVHMRERRLLGFVLGVDTVLALRLLHQELYVAVHFVQVRNEEQEAEHAGLVLAQVLAKVVDVHGRVEKVLRRAMWICGVWVWS